MKQAAMYVKHGALPERIYTDPETDKLVFEYTVDKTKGLYDLWQKRQLT